MMGSFPGPDINNPNFVNRETNDLEKEEVDIVTGALVYKEKTVRGQTNKTFYGRNLRIFSLS
jgi:hypothetical protein